MTDQDLVNFLFPGLTETTLKHGSHDQSTHGHRGPGAGSSEGDSGASAGGAAKPATAAKPAGGRKIATDEDLQSYASERGAKVEVTGGAGSRERYTITGQGSFGEDTKPHNIRLTARTRQEAAKAIEHIEARGQMLEMNRAVAERKAKIAGADHAIKLQSDRLKNEESMLRGYERGLKGGKNSRGLPFSRRERANMESAIAERRRSVEATRRQIQRLQGERQQHVDAIRSELKPQIDSLSKIIWPKG